MFILFIPELQAHQSLIGSLHDLVKIHQRKRSKQQWCCCWKQPFSQVVWLRSEIIGDLLLGEKIWWLCRHTAEHPLVVFLLCKPRLGMRWSTATAVDLRDHVTCVDKGNAGEKTNIVKVGHVWLNFCRFMVIDAARNRARVKACYMMVAATIGACVVMIILGKQVSDNEWPHFIWVLCPLLCVYYEEMVYSGEKVLFLQTYSMTRFFDYDRLQAGTSLCQVRTWRRKQNGRRTTRDSRKQLCLRRLSDEPSLLKPQFFQPLK